MKKLLIPALALVAGTSFAELKVATVDMLKLVRNHPRYDTDNELLKTTEDDYKKKLDAIKAEGEKVQAEGKKLAEQLRNPMLAAKAKTDLEKKLMDIQQKLIGIDQRYRSEGMRSRQEFQDLQGRLLKATGDALRKRIAEYAKDEGYDAVLDSTTIPYVKESLDRTDAILKLMGVDPKKAKNPNEGK